MGELVPGYHGPFSSTTEWHAFSIGFYGGFRDFRDWDGLNEPAKENPDVEAEPHYAKGGYVAGSITRIGVYVGLTLTAVNYGLLG